MSEGIKNIASCKNKKVLISAGGTGGHVYPALTLAEQLIELGAEIEWIGTEAGIESRLVPDAGITFYTIFVQGLRGNGIKRLIKAPVTIISAVLQARKVIKASKPDIFIGFGGFASGPGALASRLLNIPVILHEQNAAMGSTNKWVSKWAKKILLAFPIEGCKGTVVGNPIRPSIVQNNPLSKRRRAKKPFRILVVGGSLGAQVINENIPRAVVKIINDIELLHQTGKTNFAKTKNTYEALGIANKVSVVEYIDDMDKAYANSDLIIARSGALTVSEIASVGLPAIFIPLPHAVDNHQFLNAQFLQLANAAVIIEQKRLNVAYLHKQIVELLQAEKLLKMAENARKCSHKDALGKMINEVLEVVNGQ